jgi:hypothetical protein
MDIVKVLADAARLLREAAAELGHGPTAATCAKLACLIEAFMIGEVLWTKPYLHELAPLSKQMIDAWGKLDVSALDVLADRAREAIRAVDELAKEE